MKMYFTRGPKLGRLCLMAEVRGPSPFCRPFILDQNNIRAFLDQHEQFEGKYIFYKPSGQLGLSPGLDIKHRLMSRLLYADPDEKQLFGAYISFSRSRSQIKFELHGASGHFGKPKDEEARLAAGRIAELLSLSGFTSNTELRPYATIISATR